MLFIDTNKLEIHMRRLIHVLENEENQNRAGKTEPPVRGLVRGMEERSGAPELRAARSLHEGLGLAETIPAAVGVRQGMHNPAALRREAVLDAG